MSRSLVLRRCLALVALIAISAACSTKKNDETSGDTTTSESVTTTSPNTTGSTTSSTSSTTIETTTSVPASQDAISVAVYWTRPSGTAHPIDIPAYHDQPNGPYPYVLFGSVTNAGARPIANPKVTVDWHLGGASVHQQTVTVLDPQGSALDSLDPGASGDLLVVVDAPVADQLTDAQPSFGLAQL